MKRPDLPAWVQEPVYIALHTSVPTPERDTELTGDGYARVNVGAPIDWESIPPVRHRVVFDAPTMGREVTHAAFVMADGSTRWLDLRTDPPTPCDPPPGWVEVSDDD